MHIVICVSQKDECEPLKISISRQFGLPKMFIIVTVDFRLVVCVFLFFLLHVFESSRETFPCRHQKTSISLFSVKNV